MSKDDNSNRCRVRYCIEGDPGNGSTKTLGYVFAESSDSLDELVYVIVQDRRTGQTITLLDNRGAIKAGMVGNKGSAFQALLGGGGGDKK